MKEERLLQEFRTIKQQVEYLLENYPSTRNNDFYLLWLWLKIFKGLPLPWLDWKVFRDIPSISTVSRVRRKIQNEEGRFLPTDPEVLRERGWREEAIRRIIRKV